MDVPLTSLITGEILSGTEEFFKSPTQSATSSFEIFRILSAPDKGASCVTGKNFPG